VVAVTGGSVVSSAFLVDADAGSRHIAANSSITRIGPEAPVCDEVGRVVGLQFAGFSTWRRHDPARRSGPRSHLRPPGMARAASV
jgi:hypothetical protein